MGGTNCPSPNKRKRLTMPANRRSFPQIYRQSSTGQGGEKQLSNPVALGANASHPPCRCGERPIYPHIHRLYGEYESLFSFNKKGIYSTQCVLREFSLIRRQWCVCCACSVPSVVHLGWQDWVCVGRGRVQDRPAPTRIAISRLRSNTPTRQKATAAMPCANTANNGGVCRV